MVQVTRLAHVGLHAKTLSDQAAFYNDRWGLERVDEHGDPKTARVFEGGHMAPGPRTVATIANWVTEKLA